MEKTVSNFFNYKYLGDGKNLRYGQAFVNFFEIKDDPKLFYSDNEEESRKTANQYIEDWQIPLI